MKKILVLLFVASILAGSYFAYDRWFALPKVDAWQFIPKNAAVIIETFETLPTYDSVKTLGIWRILENMPFGKAIEDKLAEFESIDENESLRDVFRKNASLIALFPVSVNEMDALFVLGLNSNKQHNYLKRGIEFYKTAGYQVKLRNYNGFTIEEFYKGEGEVFSFIRFQNYLVGSFSSFLVEDAIRAFNSMGKMSFVSEFNETKRLKPLEQDEGNIYINRRELNSILNLFPEVKHEMFGRSAFLDMNFQNSSIKLTGFTFPEAGLLSTFTGEQGTFDLLDVVPNNTARLTHYSFEDAAAWRANLLDFDKNIGSNTDQLKTEFDIDVDFLFAQINQEIAVADLEVLGAESPDRLIFFDTKNIAETSQFLKQAAQRMASDSVFIDRVGEYVVQKLDVGIANALLGNRSTLQGECYFITHQEYVILSNSLFQLKRLIQSLESDNTWRRSLRVNTLLNLGNRGANYSVFVHVPRSWNQLMNILKPSWKPFFEAREVELKSLEYLSFQFSKVNDKFYTNVVAYQPTPTKQPVKVKISKQLSLGSKVITKPFLIKSHVNQALEVLVQDSAFQLYHVSSAFNILWNNRLTEPIIGAIVPVDYYKNGKTQYAFSTTSQLHIIDRNGVSIEGFPLTVPTPNELAHFSVVDYDGSKDYRFMLTDSQGDIYLLDKFGHSLAGWNPKSTDSPLFSAPRHIRVAGKDAFIIVKKKGIIDLLNRRGVSYSGFPLELKNEIKTAYFTEATGSFETSKMTTLTEGGEIFRINFSGRMEYRKQLFKPDENTTFELIPDVLENTFVILRNSENLWEVLDSGGEKLFEKAYPKNTNQIIQFYRFGGGRELLLVTDVAKELLTLYDLDGKTLTQKPLRSSNPASVLFSENKNSYTLYLGHDSMIAEFKL